MADIVISYSRENEATVRQLADALTREGYDVWRDDSPAPTAESADQIAEQIGRARAVVVVWSETAAASEWVKAEANVARGLKKLVQVSADDYPPPIPFSAAQAASVSSWMGEPGHPGWEQIKTGVAALAGPPPAAAPPTPPVGEERTVISAAPLPPAPPLPPQEPVAAPPPPVEPVAPPPPPPPPPPEPVAPPAPAPLPPEPVAPPPPPPAPPPEPVAPPPPPPAPPPPQAPAPLATAAPAKKKSKKGLILGLLFLLVVAAGTGAAIAWQKGWINIPGLPSPQDGAASGDFSSTLPGGPDNALPPDPVMTGEAPPDTAPPETTPDANALAGAETAPAGDAQFTQDSVIRNAQGFALVRSGPDGGGLTVGRIAANESFRTYPQEGPWWRVRLANGTIGYVEAASIRSRAQVQQAETRAAEARRRPTGPRINRQNSENMRLFCAGPGKGTPPCRVFQQRLRNR